MTVFVWIGFVAIILGLLTLDLAVLNRRPHAIRVREALLWTGMYVLCALAFNALVYFMYEGHWLGVGVQSANQYAEPDGRAAATKFFVGYLVELSLSLDNIFVIAMIFAYFRIPLIYQHRVLFWGILGAQIMRGVMIGVGTVLVHQFEWILYIFGALLIYTAFRMARAGEQDIEPEHNPLLKVARRLYPVAPLEGQRFFTRLDGQRAITPLFLVLLLVESTDVMFAIDSIPAIFIITQDPFIVFTSNIFAVLGLRSMYFALAAVLDMFRYLRYSLVFVLAYIGIKMLISWQWKIPIEVSLAIIASALAAGVLTSIVVTRRAHWRSATAGWSALALQTWRHARRVVVVVTGFTVLLAGFLMIVTPGPGLAGILLGLAILATEFVWARRWLRIMKERAESIAKIVTGNKNRKPGGDGDNNQPPANAPAAPQDESPDHTACGAPPAPATEEDQTRGR